MDIFDVIKNAKNTDKLQGATAQEIHLAEEALSLKFSEEYKKYTAEFGAVSIGASEYTGVVQDADLNVVTVTNAARSMTPQAPVQWYVVKDLHVDGIVVWQDENGMIYKTAPNREPVKLAESLAAYISITAQEEQD